MARPLRIEFPGAIYLVTSRGDRREPIVLDDDDREDLLIVLGQALHRVDDGVYTQRFNRRHSKVGHLFQGRYKAILVDRDAYLLEVCRYVELNRVRANLVEHPAQWLWCSHHALTCRSAAPEWLDVQAVWGYLLGHDPKDERACAQAAQAYAALVQAGQGVQLWAQGLRQQMYLGDDDFVLRMQALASDRTVNAKEFQKHDAPAPRACKTGWPCAPRVTKLWCRRTMHHKISLSQIARQLGLSVARVSRIVSA